jgi:hypothetical protein
MGNAVRKIIGYILTAKCQHLAYKSSRLGGHPGLAAAQAYNTLSQAADGRLIARQNSKKLLKLAAIKIYRDKSPTN